RAEKSVRLNINLIVAGGFRARQTEVRSGGPREAAAGEAPRQALYLEHHQCGIHLPHREIRFQNQVVDVPRLACEKCPELSLVTRELRLRQGELTLRRGGQESQLLKDVTDRLHQPRAVPQQGVWSLRERIVDTPRHRKYLTVLIDRAGGRDEGAASASR